MNTWKMLSSTLFLIYFSTIVLIAQVHMQGGGSPLPEHPKGPCLSTDDRAQIKQTLHENRARLVKTGLLSSERARSQQVVQFIWPMQKSAALPYQSYYATYNFVDHNPIASGTQYGASNLDYNCGNRTYDDTSGYNHQGTDYVTWPFPWHLYENDLVTVVAAAAGTIIGKDDGQDDDHCAPSGNWNAVYLEHSDGSVSWYGHLKKNSLTSKAIGQTVSQGEYLGVVASSGLSNIPHLHFEVYDAVDQLIDPYAGSCNGLNGTTSWWANQPAYQEPTLNALLSHSAVPVHACPSDAEDPRFANVFSPGQAVYLATYYHDQQANDVSIHRIRRPDQSVWTTWQHSSLSTYISSWWLSSFDLPSSGPFGEWTFEVSYRGETFTHRFQYIDAGCSGNGINFWVGPSNGNWTSSSGNWSMGEMPGPCHEVFIPAGYTVHVPAGATASCFTLEVQEGGTLDVHPTAELAVQNP